MSDEQSLQEKFSAQSICYGCGPANDAGLHIRSYPEGDTCVCEWTPDPKFQAFPGTLYGGLIGCLFDCHCNWTGSHHIMKANGLEHPPCTVTAEFSVKFLKPTPSDKPVRIVAKVVESKEDRAVVEGELFSDGVLCATSRGKFVAVKPGHPAYHRW